MTPAEIIAMAQEAGFANVFWSPQLVTPLERFAALVSAQAAAQERERCAQVCDATYYQNIGPAFGEVRHGIAACATAIRALGDAMGDKP